MEKMFKKFMEFAFGNMIVLILGFFTSPLITRIILPSEYGKYSMFDTITNLILIIVLLGLDQAYVRFYYEEDNYGKIKLLKQSIKFTLFSNLILSIIIIALYRPISYFIVEEVSLAIVILVVIQNFIAVLMRFSQLVIRMEQKGKKYSLVQIIIKVLYLLFTIILYICLRNNYLTLVIATIISSLIGVIIAIFLERKIWFTSGKCIIKKTSDKKMIKFGIPLIFSMIINWIFQSIDRICIKRFCGFSDVGIYSAAFSIIAIINAFQGAFTTFWVPIANEKYQENPKEGEFFGKVFRVVCLAMFSMCSILVIFKHLIIKIIGSQYKDAEFVFPFLIFIPLMYTISEITVVGINFKSKTIYHVVIAFVSAFCNVVGNIILIPLIGVKGAAISTGFSYIVFFTLRTLISYKLFKVRYDIKKVILVLIPMILLALNGTVYEANIIFYVMGLVTLLVIFFVYINQINYIMETVKTVLKRYKK